MLPHRGSPPCVFLPRALTDRSAQGRWARVFRQDVRQREGFREGHVRPPRRGHVRASKRWHPRKAEEDKTAGPRREQEDSDPICMPVENGPTLQGSKVAGSNDGGNKVQGSGERASGVCHPARIIIRNIIEICEIQAEDKYKPDGVRPQSRAQIDDYISQIGRVVSVYWIACSNGTSRVSDKLQHH